MKRNDNRGASFVMVVVAMAIVAVLAVTVLWIALMNLQMKVTDEKNTDNFYSAEGVLDQICTGLQEIFPRLTQQDIQRLWRITLTAA